MSAEEQDTLAHGLLDLVEEMREALRRELSPFWEIVHKLAETDTYIYTGNNRMECLFCDTADFPIERMRDHQPDCIVMKARALVAQRKELLS
jgi:hypothetical protein